jgi:signal transduction histidine kinase
VPVTAIVEDREETLWFGTHAGLARYAGGRFTAFGERDGLSSDHVRSLYVDGDGVVWIGTYDGGLSRFADGAFTRYTTREGLFANGVFQTLEDDRGNLWMTSNRGIFRVAKRELNAYAAGATRSITSLAYGTRDGLASAECNGGRQPAGWRMRDGTLWFPTQRGVAIVDPNALPLNSTPPPVAIEAVRIDDVDARFGESLEVAPGAASFEVHYTALSFVNPEGVRFRYKLDGWDGDWVDAGSRRTAYYNHVAPGDYTFTVLAANRDGVWNTQGRSLRVVVVPPVWRTVWFRALVSLWLVAAAAALYRWRVRRFEAAHALRQAHARQLNASQERERQRIAKDLHDGLGQSLVIIRSLALKTLPRSDDPDVVRERLREIAEAIEYASHEAKEIAYNSRPPQLDDLGLGKAIEGMVRRASDAGGIAFTTQVDPIDDVFAPEAQIDVYRIVQEAVSNVLRHSQATKADVVVSRKSDSISIVVRDDGRGLPSDAGGNGGDSLRGSGLTGIAERARLLGGAHQIRSAPAGGVSVIVTLPIVEVRRGAV